jgi:3-phenylpropionate/cinnamic acid dioxygenase small subunit
MDSVHDAIANLIYAYAERLDAGDFEAVAEMFAHATFRSNSRPEVRRGSAAVLDVYRATVTLHENGTPCTKHVTTNLMIDVDAGGRTASARCYFTVLQARPELPLQAIIAGRYQDAFALFDGVWCFTDRLVLVDLLGDLRFHLKRDVGVAS